MGGALVSQARFYLRQFRLQTEVDHFREEAFIKLVVILIGLVCTWAAFALSAQQIDLLAANLLIFTNVFTGWLIHRLYRTRYLAAALLFLLWQIMVIGAMLWLEQEAARAALFVLPIVIAGTLLGSAAAFVVAGLTVGAELVLMWLLPELSALAGLLPLLITQQALVAVVAWLAAVGFYDALDSAEMSAQKASRFAGEARQHRAELQRTLQSVDLLNYQLRRTNAELFRARQIADAALRYKREFAAQISHELRTSLNLILGFSETMAFAQQVYGENLPGVYLRDVTEIYRNSRHLLALVDDVLDLSKLEAGRLGLRREPVDIGPVVQEAVDIVRPAAEMKSLVLICERADTLPILSLDRGRMSQILLNLLHNAVRVTTAGVVSIRVQVDEAELVIEVADTGPGISPADLETIFEEFSQLENTGGSVGLGLAVSKQIVNLHGGRIWVDSEIGQGTTFSVAFPLQDAVPLSPIIAGKPIPPSHAPQPAVVVIGQETSDEVRLLARHLADYAVAPAPSWPSAVELIGQVGARAVIAPSSHIQSEPTPAVHVPIISCKLPGSQQTALSLNVDAYIQKPVTMAAIESAVQDIAPNAAKILVVDDDPNAVRIIERMIRATRPDASIVRAYSGREGIVRAIAHHPDLIVLDLAMPDGDGIEMIQRLRCNADTVEIPLMAVSGRAVEEMWQSGAIWIEQSDGFTPTETLNYLQAMLSAAPPAPMERYTNAPPSPAGSRG